jgi:CPSF A subunit region
VDKTGLQSIVDWHHNYLVTSLSARGSRLFVGDAICSVSIIDLVEAEGGGFRLEPVAKDFSPLWPVTVKSLDRDTIIGANVSHFLLEKDSNDVFSGSLRVIATFSLIPSNGERPRRL